MSTVDDIERVYTGSVPQDITSSALGQALRRAIAEALTLIDSEGQTYVAGSRLGTAVNGYLDLHAKDRGLRRQTGETDDQLRERLRKPPKAVTLEAIREAVEAIIGDAGPVVIIELPRSSLYLDRAGAPPFAPETQYAMCLDRGRRCGGGRGVVIVLIPSAANAVQSVTDALRSKVAAGKLWFVQEYDDAASLPRPAKNFYPWSASEMNLALAVDDANWDVGWVFDEESGDCVPKFGSPNFLSANGPLFTRIDGLRDGSRALTALVGLSQRFDAMGVGAPGAGPFKAAMIVKFPAASYNLAGVLAYGNIANGTWMLLHSGSASSDPEPNQVRFIISDGTNTTVADADVPPGEWCALVFGLDRLGTTAFIAAAHAGGSHLGQDNAVLMGSVTSATNQLKLGAIDLGTTSTAQIDALYFSDSEMNSLNALTIAENLWNFVNRT